MKLGKQKRRKEAMIDEWKTADEGSREREK